MRGRTTRSLDSRRRPGAWTRARAGHASGRRKLRSAAAVAVTAAMTVVAIAGLGARLAPVHAASTMEGVDLSTSQPDVDMTAAARAGISFAIVKTGGSQAADSPYVSPHYVEQVDAVRAAGLQLGHYWVVGDRQTPTAAADYFVTHLHDYRSGDVLALDDEALDGSRIWTDSEASTFLREVQARMGAVPLWFYTGAYALRVLEYR